MRFCSPPLAIDREYSDSAAFESSNAFIYTNYIF
jgi:hypothetical protein